MKEMSMKTEHLMGNRKVYLELLRGIAVLLVIFNHTDGFFLYYTNTKNVFTFVYSLFFSILCRVNVPLFFMISGALLLKEDESLAKLFQKRILRIAVVILLFSFMQYVVDLAEGKDIPVSAAYFIKGVASGTIQETYWFLYAYMGMLFIIPFLRSMVKGMNGELFRYLLVLEAAMAVFVPIICSLSGMKVSSSMLYLNDYVFYMLMGYALEHGKLYGGREERAWYTCAGSVCCIVLGMLVCWLRFQKRGEYFQNDLDLFTPILSVLVFETVRRFCGEYPMADGIRKLVLLAGSCVFGIYLIEQPVRAFLLPVYLYLTERSVGVVACSVYVLMTWLVSLILVFALKRIPGVRRLI